MRGSLPAGAIKLAGAVGRPSYLLPDGDMLRICIPRALGSKPWSLPIADVGVVNLANVDEPAADQDEPAVLRSPLDVPYVATRSELAAPNVALLFRSTLRVPQLPRFGFGEPLPRRASRSRGGLWLDGLQVEAVQPVEAVITLLAAGAERVLEPVEWLVARRPVVREPITPSRVTAHQRVQRWEALALLISVATLIAMRVVAVWSTATWTAVVAVLSVIVMGGTVVDLARRDRRIKRLLNDSGASPPEA